MPRHPNTHRARCMTIYHLSAKPPIARAHGRCATAAIAYRAAAAIRDTRTGLVFDYSRKRGVIDTRLVLPGGNCVADRAAFWDGVEVHHRRKDAVTAREVVVALPAELSADARAALAFAFSRDIADRFSVAVDCALHAPSADGDDRNFHAHILITACAVGKDGVLGKKAELLDPIACRLSNMQDSVSWLRPHWAELVNAALEGAGRQERVDHRSHKARNINRVPTVHIGPRGPAAGRRMALHLKLRTQNMKIELIEQELSGLRAVHARETLSINQPALLGRSQARLRMQYLISRCAEIESQILLLPAFRVVQKTQLRQLVAAYSKEIRTLNSLVNRAEVSAVQASFKGGRKR